jgi:serine/threonine-protein kinase
MIRSANGRSSSRTDPTGGGDATIENLIEEITNRLQAGEKVGLEEIERRHPEHAERIARLLPALRTMAQLGQSAIRDVAGLAAPGPDPVLGLGELGDYRLVREIGRGGMGVVYEATQISLNRRVALKVLPFAGALDPQHLARFRLEAQAAAQLHHTNIVPVFAVGCERGVHYYAMQFIEGQTLAALIRDLREGETPHEDTPAGTVTPSPTLASRLTTDGPSPTEIEPSSPRGEGSPEGRMRGPSAPIEPKSSKASSQSPSIRARSYFRNVANLALQAAEALEHAHRFGILHRDIKPANLLVDVRGNLWVTDFGLARCVDDAGLTMTGDLLGTLRYMSPEQALGHPAVIDTRSDVYSLGVTLYELLTLCPAFRGRDRQELLRQVAFEEPPLPRKLNPAVPRELETIVLKAMAKEPGFRYASARDLADDLRRFLEDKPIHARRPTAFEQFSKWVRRHPSIAIAAVTTLMTTAIVLAVAVILITREQIATQSALRDARDDRERAMRYAEVARSQTEQSTERAYVVLHSLGMLLLRVGDETLPDVPQVRDLRRSVEDHCQATIEGFIKSSSLDPQTLSESIAACHHLADLCFASGRVEESARALALAIDLSNRLVLQDSSRADYRLLLGNTQNILGLKLYAGGRQDEAIQHFQRAHRTYLAALQSEPADHEVRRRLRWLLAVCPEPGLRDPDRVLALTDEMVEIERMRETPLPFDTSRSPHWLFRGIGLYRKGRFESAIDVLDGPLRTVDRDQHLLYGAGDLALGQFVLAMAYHRTGQRTRGLESFDAGVRIMQTTCSRVAEIMIFRAEAAALLGQKYDAMLPERNRPTDGTH